LLAAAALIVGTTYARAAAATVIALFGVALLDPTKTDILRRITKTVEREMIVLKDKRGVTRIVIHAENGIMFYDDKEKVKMVADVNDGQPGIMFYDDNETVKMAAKIIGGQPGIVVQDGKECVVATVSNTGANLTVGRIEGAGPGCATRVTSGHLLLGPADMTGIMLDATGDKARMSLSGPGDKDIRFHVSAGSEQSIVGVGKNEKPHVSIIAADNGELDIALQVNGGKPSATLGYRPGRLSFAGRSFSLAGRAFYGENGLPMALYPDSDTLVKYLSALMVEKPNSDVSGR